MNAGRDPRDGIFSIFTVDCELVASCDPINTKVMDIIRSQKWGVRLGVGKWLQPLPVK